MTVDQLTFGQMRRKKCCNYWSKKLLTFLFSFISTLLITKIKIDTSVIEIDWEITPLPKQWCYDILSITKRKTNSSSTAYPLPKRTPCRHKTFTQLTFSLTRLSTFLLNGILVKLVKIGWISSYFSTAKRQHGSKFYLVKDHENWK